MHNMYMEYIERLEHCSSWGADTVFTFDMGVSCSGNRL